MPFMLNKTFSNTVTIADILMRRNELNNLSDTPRLDIEIILAHVLEVDRTYLYAWPNFCLSDIQQSKFNQLFTDRLLGKPIAYITEVREFWSLPLKVSTATIIPRPETELLVEIALSLPLSDNISVLDLGTGSGAIALALASEKKSWDIKAVDSEPNALKLAEQNRKIFDFDNVKIQKSDWFSCLKESFFDLIVSNPPYISSDDKNLQQGGLRFEPISALVSEDSGIADIRKIIFDARNFLNFGGWLILEHAYDQGAEVRQLMMDASYSEIKTFSDISDLDRVTICKKTSN
jgi:release factor glutamine methyltransferase